MQSCSIPHWVLFSLTLTFTPGPTLAFTSVTVKFNQSATLPCNYKCSGSAKWTMFHNPGFILAQCNQNTCRSEKGYEMFHDQYMEGKLYLTITAADYSKRALYTCDCDGVEACDVHLIIDAIMSSVQLTPGEALVMDLPISEPMEVIYKPMDSAGLYGAQICTVDQRSLQCEADYTLRTSLSHTNIILRDVNVSDSGLYTIRDKNDEDIHIYTLFVKEVQPDVDSKQKSHQPEWLMGVVVAVVSIVTILIITPVVWCWMKNKSKKCENILLPDNPEFYVNWRRAYSDTDLPQATLKEDMKKLIQQHRPTAIRLHENAKEIRARGEDSVDWQKHSSTYPEPSKRKRNLMKLKQQCKDRDGPLKENEAERESCSNGVAIQMEEKNPLMEQNKAGAVMVNQQNLTAKYNGHRNKFLQ